MKKLILTQQKLADAYAVPVTSSIYNYFLELSNRKENMVGLILGEYQFFDDGSIVFEENDLKEIVVSGETMEAWKKFKKTSGQTPLLFSDYHFSLVSLRISESIVAENLAEAAAELVKNNEKYFGLKVTRMDYFKDGIVCKNSFILRDENLYTSEAIKNYVANSFEGITFLQEKGLITDEEVENSFIGGFDTLKWIDSRISEGHDSFILDFVKGEIAVPEKNTTFLPLRTFVLWGVSI